MKKILVTGAGSYIGVSFQRYLSQWPKEYIVESIDMMDDKWKSGDFSGYDAIYHVAGIAHIKETKENSDLYYKVNRDLAVDVAKKAKDDGVKQFILMSSMSVYGINTGTINKETVPVPKSNYGKSKLQAEEAVKKLADEDFAVAILRPPMVYGKGCKGNLQSLIAIVDRVPIFPNVSNKRSMIYIDNLTSFVKMCIDENLAGLYYPQNAMYISTKALVQAISLSMNKKILLSKILGLVVKFLMLFSSTAKKAFGTLVYENTDDFNFSYCVVDNNDSFKNLI